MFGAIAGDILGSVHEFNPLKTKDFELFNPNCMFTDDTVMTIAVADAAMNHEPYSDTLQTWGRRYPFAGYGSWFGKWIFSETPEPYNSFGNGSAMRVSSIGWLYDEEKRVLEEASKSAQGRDRRLRSILKSVLKHWRFSIDGGRSLPWSWSS